LFYCIKKKTEIAAKSIEIVIYFNGQGDNMKFRNRVKSEILHKGIYYLLVLFLAVGLKYYYSRTGSEDLVWILSPTASFVEYLSGTHFEPEFNVGYISSDRAVAIVPACAGLNFMIAAFCMAALWLLYSMKRKALLPLCVISALTVSYLLTVAVNSLRIVISMHLYKVNIYTQLITPARVHRIEGVIIYIVFLSLFYFVLRKTTSVSKLFAMDKKRENRGGIIKDALFTILVPLFWYFMIALAAPIMNGAHHHNAELFREHFLAVLLSGLIIFIIIFLILMCYNYFIQRNKNTTTGVPHEIKNINC
jgi:exosortase K